MTRLTSKKRLKLATNPNEPATKFRVPTRPKAIPQSMQAEFRETVLLLHSRGVWDIGKLPLVESLLASKNIERQCLEMLVAEGLTERASGTGDTRPHHATVILAKMQPLILRATTALGLVGDTRGGVNNRNGANQYDDKKSEPEASPWVAGK